MTTIYVVTAGEYSDYHIVGIFDEAHKAEAEALARHIEGQSAQPEEYVLNEGADLIAHGLYPFDVRIGVLDSEDSSVSRRESYSADEQREPRFYVPFREDVEMIWLYVFAHDEQHALKIASEQRAELIATGAVDAWRAAGRP